MSLRRRPLLAAPRLFAKACLAAVLLACALPSTALAQQRSEAEIQDDIEFAKGLAREWGFVDLAGRVIEKIEKGGVSAKTGERLGVVKCDIYAQAALAERDRVRRNELFELAMSAYEDFLKKNPNSASAAEAESDYLNTASAFAKSLEISMEDAVGAEAEQLRQRRISVLEAAVARTGDLLQTLKSIEDPTEAQKRERGSTMLMRGRMLLELGRSQDDGTFSFDLAQGVLEEAVFDQGEGTPIALQAYDLIGQVFAAQGKPADAAIYFEAVIISALPADAEMWKTMVDELELTQADKDQRWLFVELSSAGLIDSLMAAGQVDQAMKYALHLYDTQKIEGFEYSKMGYESLLAAGHALLDAGGVVGGNLSKGEGHWYPSEDAAREAGVAKKFILPTTDMALKIGQQVVNENQGNVLQIRGQKLMAEVLQRPGVEVDVATLYQVFEGYYNSGEYDKALLAYVPLMLALEGKDKATSVLYAPGTYFRVGRIYQRQERTLEAAMAYREGCTTYLGDPQHDGANAQGFYKAMQDLTEVAPGDSQLKALLEESQRLAAELNTQDANQIKYDLAETARKAKEYDKAIEFYSQIERSWPQYDKALVKIAVCTYRKGPQSAGYQLFVDYLEKYVTDPINAVGESETKAAARRDSMAQALFYRTLYEDSQGKYQEVVDHAERYYLDYPDQDSLAPWTMRMVGVALMKLGRNADAKAYLQKALDAYPGNNQVAAFAVTFYTYLREQFDAEVDPNKKQAILREMAELLEIGNKADTTPNYANLRAESNHWFDLHEWQKARGVLEKIVAKFGDDAELEKDMVTYVKPDLAHVYLELKQTAEAHAILTELVANDAKRPSKRTLVDYARSITGWLEGTATDIRVVPGAGMTEEEFNAAEDKLNALANSVDAKWSCEWYLYKFMAAYANYVWATAEGGPRNSSRKDVAQSQLKILTTELTEQFTGGHGVDGVGATCDGDQEFAAEYGDDVLRRRFVWLWAKVSK
ncbi:MAG: tetratricopeptide repeat protein [Planctomycetes bacterium]|nr:tetratricopeptide repeat protein [Planctomycetota bacterium]